mmetsp:Transcript_105134/g.146549  ORF Transcript_105134/g.146549 Transcript_105134/m.146549 type:complete len:123 (+) Transcript_105134:31-399(+)|eukprot:s1106_g13.t1
MGSACSGELNDSSNQELLAVDKAKAVQPQLKGTAVSTNTLREVFRQCDANNDNFVTRIELIKACKSHPEIAQMLGIPENLRDSARSQFEQVYQALDADSDRKVSLDELRAYFVRAGFQVTDD